MGKKILLVTVAMITSFYAGYKLNAQNTSEKNLSETEQSSSLYPLLAKRLFVENPNDIRVNFDPLRQQIRNYVIENKLQGSVYFEYLPTGTSIRVDGDSEEIAASLIKLPVAMELYKAAEMNKVDLDAKIAIKQEWLDDSFGELYKKGTGYQLTLREAAEIMLRDSDNTALQAIVASTIDLVPANEGPFRFLDVDFRQNEDFTVAISARAYSSFLKCLYFSCYLNNANSQELIEYLVESSEKDRLVAGVSDQKIKIAHKIGNFSQVNQSDCGIFYLENRNYILCVMINGPDNPVTDSHIATISKLAYDFVKN